MTPVAALMIAKDSEQSECSLLSTDPGHLTATIHSILTTLQVNNILVKYLYLKYIVSVVIIYFKLQLILYILSLNISQRKYLRSFLLRDLNAVAERLNYLMLSVHSAAECGTLASTLKFKKSKLH